jgi:solute carrier family 25 phosphate transporter 23/24/25/41
MYKEEGFAGFMRGNGINCARVSLDVPDCGRFVPDSALQIIPYSAVQFTTYEALKTVRTPHPSSILQPHALP